jgi:hypothetical protein
MLLDAGYALDFLWFSVSQNYDVSALKNRDGNRDSILFKTQTAAAATTHHFSFKATAVSRYSSTVM